MPLIFLPLSKSLKAKRTIILGQLWKLNGTTLVNREGNWKSSEKWEFQSDGYFILNIKNIKKNKVLETGEFHNDTSISLQPFKPLNWGQKWKKGRTDKEGYFVLINPRFGKVLTAATNVTLKLDKSKYLL